MGNNPISATISLDQDGVHHGFLNLPFSHNLSAWGSIPIPITIIKNGTGPTALLTGGNHGDEYEGPIALFDLANRLTMGEVAGRVIIVPAMNFPAFKEGTRLSPIDNKNMNRIFPGKADGTVSEKIADYFYTKLLPLADYVLDMHSGGRSLDCVPFSAVHVQANKDWQARCVAAMKAFNAPYALFQLEIDGDGMYDTAAEKMGKIFISTELGGGSTATAERVNIAKQGVRNLLIHAGILQGEIDYQESILLNMPDAGCFISSEHAGLVEYCCDLGDNVSQNQPVAKIHNIHSTGEAPVMYSAQRDGVFVIKHHPGLIDRGDIIGVVADRYRPEADDVFGSSCD